MKENAKGLGLYKIKNCLVFAMKDSAGKIVNIYGRSVSESTKSRHFYLSGHFQGLYPQYPSPNTKHLILTESIIDAASLLTSEIKNAEGNKINDGRLGLLALYGTNGFTAITKRQSRAYQTWRK